MMTFASLQAITQYNALYSSAPVVLVDNLTEFVGDISFDDALTLVASAPTLKSFNPKASASALDNMRYLGYAERYATLSTGEIIHQLLTKSFGEPTWINLPAGATVTTIDK